MSEEPETLTLRATGPAAATHRDDADGVEIATTSEVELEATLDVDADWLTEHAYVSRHSEASLYADDVAALVCSARSASDGDFEPLEGWTLELSGSFEAWATVAVGAADATVSVRSDKKRANAACHVLTGLAEHAVDERPRLVMLDVLGSYNPSDFSKQNVLSALSAPESEPPAEVTPTAEASADD